MLFSVCGRVTCGEYIKLMMACQATGGEEVTNIVDAGSDQAIFPLGLSLKPIQAPTLAAEND